MTRRGDHWDKIATSAPINAQAAKQMGRGQTWEPSVQVSDWLGIMPELRSTDYSKRNNPEFVDYTRRKFGRLTVLGIMKKSGNGPASWVCRCVCGYFCTRRAKSLRLAEKGGNGFVDRCGRCEYQRKISTGWLPQIKPREKKND